MTAMPELRFDGFYTYDEMVAFLRAAHECAAGRMTLHELADTPEGRKVFLTEMTDPTTGPGEDKPAYYVQANVHAQEGAGTTAALHLIRNILTTDDFADLLKRVVFYVVPRVNPDGTEYALTRRAEIRSRFYEIERKNGLVPKDLNGDGLILTMRWEDPAGPMREDDVDPRIMVRRDPGDTQGPFYQVAQEGIIQDYDGTSIGNGTRGIDFNRNWPMNWRPEHEQGGASDYPFSQPEMRAVGTFVLEHPNIFAGVDVHCGSNAILRPPSKPDSELDQDDLTRILEIGKIAEEITGFPLMCTRDYKTSWRNPLVLRGNSNDFAYFQLGISHYVIELGNGFNHAGIGTREYLDADDKTKERDYMRRVLALHDRHNSPLFVPWKAFDHPQLGKVEIGGIMKGVGYYMVPPLLGEIVPKTTAFIETHAQRHPQLMISRVETQAISENVYRVRAAVGNVGGFSTCVMASGQSAPSNKPVRVGLADLGDAEVVSRGNVREVASLGGRGETEHFEWFVKAHAGCRITVEARNPRAGVARQSVELR